MRCGLRSRLRRAWSCAVPFGVGVGVGVVGFCDEAEVWPFGVAGAYGFAEGGPVGVLFGLCPGRDGCGWWFGFGCGPWSGGDGLGHEALVRRGHGVSSWSITPIVRRSSLCFSSLVS